MLGSASKRAYTKGRTHQSGANLYGFHEWIYYSGSSSGYQTPPLNKTEKIKDKMSLRTHAIPWTYKIILVEQYRLWVNIETIYTDKWMKESHTFALMDAPLPGYRSRSKTWQACDIPAWPHPTIVTRIIRFLSKKGKFSASDEYSPMKSRTRGAAKLIRCCTSHPYIMAGTHSAKQSASKSYIR